jgi:hypothetical protein
MYRYVQVCCRHKQRYKLTAMSGVKGTLQAHVNINSKLQLKNITKVLTRHVYYARLLPYACTELRRISSQVTAHYPAAPTLNYPHS